MRAPSARPIALVALGAALLLVGSWWGLAKAPGEVFMGDVQRIMYVHVPTAWNAMLALTFAFVCAVCFLFTNAWKWDNRLEAAMEMGVVLSLLLCMQGSIWAKPTWGVWWTWEPRLVTTAVMFVMYVGYLLLRSLSTDFDRRATRAAILGVILVLDVPIVHLSVLWANSLHQLPTVLRAGGSPALDSAMLLTLMVSVAAFTLVYLYFMSARVAIELSRRMTIWGAAGAQPPRLP